MIRNFKSVVAVLLALGAVGVITASSAEPSESPEFTAAEYPATLSATSSEVTVFDAFGESFKCEHVEYKGELASGPSSKLVLIPKFTGCTTSSGRFTTFTFTGCHLVETVGQQVGKHTFVLVAHRECTDPKEKIHMEVYHDLAEDIKKPNEPRCEFTVSPPWTEETHLTKNTETGAVELSGTTQAVTVTQTRNDPLCPEGTHTTEGKSTNAKPIALTAKNKSGKSIEFDVG
jgi:hypothetical protein